MKQTNSEWFNTLVGWINKADALSVSDSSLYYNYSLYGSGYDYFSFSFSFGDVTVKKNGIEEEISDEVIEALNNAFDEATSTAIDELRNRLEALKEEETILIKNIDKLR